MSDSIFDADTTEIPSVTPWLLPAEPFNDLIAQTGARATYARSHTCPCIYAGGGTQGRLPFPGSPVPGCSRCFGVGTYWDQPTEPFSVGVSFMHLSPSPDEPGTIMNAKNGPVQTSEPSLTVPYLDPKNPTAPLNAWLYGSTNDFFTMVDMVARYIAVLQVGGIQSLPFQQNLQIAPTGAVTTFVPSATNSGAGDVVPISYVVNGATVTIDTATWPVGQNYMVEFQAAPIYVVWRRAGGLPHVRPFGNGNVNLPRRFRLQALDFWTRQRANNPSQQASLNVAGTAFPYVVMSGLASIA